MSKHRQLNYGQPIPQDFLDALQEFVGVGSRNLFLTQIGSNQVQIAAGVGNAQVSLGIDGLWRYISATVQTTVTGAAGTYSIFATTGNNAFATNPTPPPPETDSTDYTFALTALLTGNPTAAHYRKIGEAVFDGTRILNLRQLIDGGVDGAQLWQPGDLKLTAVAAPPAGWLACDGSAVSRTTYPALFAALGGATSPWGQGDGSTTFNVPDFRGRVPIGAGQGAGLTNRVRGEYGGGTLDTASPKRGEEAHLLAAAESGTNGNGGTGYVSNDHSHGVSIQSGGASARHNHATVDTGQLVPASNNWVFAANNMAITAGSYPLIYPDRASTQNRNTTGADSPDHSHGVNGNTAGISSNHTHALGARNADSSHNNVQPYAAAIYIVKT